MPWSLFLGLIAYYLTLVHFVSTESTQYCESGLSRNQNEDIQFCVGLNIYENVSSHSHDFFLTINYVHQKGDQKGWLSVGLGEVMQGALMFVIYGDPLDSKPPFLSIRSTRGHHDPVPITDVETNGVEIRLLRSEWLSRSDTDVAIIELVCFSCELWPGTPVSASTTAQSWIWAWNSQQEFPEFSYDAPLEGHAHLPTPGGWGSFYIDMAQSFGPMSAPGIRPGVTAYGAYAASPKVSSKQGILLIHGLCMSFVFLLILPAGVIALRSGIVRAFKYHWLIQVAASSVIIVGVIAGFLLKSEIDSTHQTIGLITGISLLIQSILGWRHHVVFLRIRHRTWLSHSHIWLGRLIMIAGWANLVTGLSLHGYKASTYNIIGLVVVGEASSLFYWILRQQRKSEGKISGHEAEMPMTEASEPNYFAIDSDDEDV
ncbi:hypothetical protein F5884DRAFT_820600 [Xylogone sp. PMI_703]|nr:hypothetical protein F5884DRAFT_820600 [Xylogone sp. PMI_703]